MKTLYSLFILFIFNCLVNSQTIDLLHQSKGISFRGMSLVSDSVVWVSGSNGSVFYSRDAGRNWQNISPKNYQKFDFRDIQAVTDSSAILMNAGSPGVLLYTKNRGKTWKEIYRNNNKNIFLDSMSSVNENQIVVIGDPIANNYPFALKISLKPHVLVQEANPKDLNFVSLAEKEAFFAASGSNVDFGKNNQEIIYATGGARANLVIASQEKVIKKRLAFMQGKETTGVNGMRIQRNNNKIQGILVGGDFSNPKDNTGIFSWFEYDGEKIKFQKNLPMPNGYKSDVDWLNQNSLIACGTTGVEILTKKAKQWQKIGTQAYHICQTSPTKKYVYLAGSNGKIAKIQL